MITVGLTGSIASGKSTVAAMFQELGGHVIDWDMLAREVVCPQMKAWQGIVDYFGRDVLNSDLTINRQKLGAIVFDDAQKRARLNGIVHPAVIEEDARRVAEIGKCDPKAIVIKDIPLLVEIGYHKCVNKVVVVYSSRRNQIERMAQKWGLPIEDARKRIEAQMPLEEKVKVADFVIRNEGSLEETRSQVEAVYRGLCQLSV